MRGLKKVYTLNDFISGEWKMVISNSLRYATRNFTLNGETYF